MMSDSAASAGCFSMLFKRSKRTKRISCPCDHEKPPSATGFTLTSTLNKSTESIISETEESFANVNGVLETFAKIAITTHGRKRHSSTLRAEKMLMYPCFGHFAGQRLYFDLKRSAEHNMMSIKVRTDDQLIATLHHRQGRRRKETARDQCIKFAHEATTHLVSYGSPSLSFLCEQVINLNLNEIPYRLLPPRYQNTFTGCDRTVTIRIHPCYIHKDLITMKLKPNLSIRELQWMISKRLSISNPLSITLYVQDSLEPLSATVPLKSATTDIVCIIAPNAQQLRASVEPGPPLSVCVSIIGKGVDEVNVYHHTTLFEFEQAVKQKFGMKKESFLYLPDVLRSSHNFSSNSYCPLRMSAMLDSSTSTALLLHHEKRSFPILYGHLSVSEQQTLQSLLLYRMTVSELDLLKSGPVIGFEVSGPTIPINLKTYSDLTSNPTEFCLLSVRPHAVSVNPNWTIGVLIKFLTSITHFECSKLMVDDKTLCDMETVESQLLNKSWFVVKQDEYILSKDIPTALTF